jgi:hypothetical protein
MVVPRRPERPASVAASEGDPAQKHRGIAAAFTQHAVIALAGELPAVVLAKLLGFSVKRAVTWNAEVGNTYPGYAAAVARRTKRTVSYG